MTAVDPRIAAAIAAGQAQRETARVEAATDDERRFELQVQKCLEELVSDAFCAKITAAVAKGQTSILLDRMDAYAMSVAAAAVPGLNAVFHSNWDPVWEEMTAWCPSVTIYFNGAHSG